MERARFAPDVAGMTAAADSSTCKLEGVLAGPCADARLPFADICCVLRALAKFFLCQRRPLVVSQQYALTTYSLAFSHSSVLVLVTVIAYSVFDDLFFIIQAVF